MSNKSIEHMKKIIEDKKKKNLQQDIAGGLPNKLNANPSKGFKNTKRSGSLNK